MTALPAFDPLDDFDPRDLVLDGKVNCTGSTPNRVRIREENVE